MITIAATDARLRLRPSARRGAGLRQSDSRRQLDERR
ncbi:hypothetical protein IWX81_002750 [Salinibacterium sp. CAN_S4]